MYDDLRQILGDTHALLAGIQAGKGTAGKLVASDEFGDEIKNTMGKVDALLDKMNNGTGSFARLMNDPALFEDLDSLTRESQGLMKDFRSNPKKFLHIKLSLF
jgi:phospholipid/cholesterol/gamma-HCH transport system substrate-binding protein